MKSITAATVITVFNGTANLGTLIGAFLCDTYFGRYKTLGFATVASFLVYSGFYNAKSNRAFHLLVCVSLPTNVKHALKRILQSINLISCYLIIVIIIITPYKLAVWL
jgi:hypothetical protein